MWQMGLAIGIAVAVCLFRQPEIAFLYALLPLMAAVVIGWQGALLAECLVILSIWWLAQGPAIDYLSPTLGLGIVTGGIFSGMVGIASISALTTTAYWFLFSFRQAQQNMETARQHRAQMVQLYKDLDQAYYQLERANSALAAARKTAEAAERFKAEFVANVSHELRTPLNLIIGFTEMMVTSPESYENMQLPGPYRSDLNTVYHNAQHLLALVDDVLDLARIEAGKIALSREEVDPTMLLTEVVGIVRNYIVAKGLQLKINVEKDLPTLWIDRLRIRQTLLNLLVNAARHTEHGRIDVDVHRQGDELVIQVTDTGQGIPEQELPRLFQEFHSTPQLASEWHSGTGLGLPISKKFVELHHGRMGVDSTYGQGTRFWFTLPCSMSRSHQANSSHLDRYRPIVRLGASERIVIVVHDDPHVASLLKRYLDGFQVIGTTNIEEGLQLAKDFKAIAMITDVNQVVPISSDHLLVVRCPLPSTHLVARGLGAQDLLLKPISRHELLAAVDKLQKPIHRALVVDDDPEVVRLFRRMLRSRIPIHDCMEAYNGEEALELIQSQKPDLVLLDLVMPEVDGKTVLAQMSADPNLTGISVILVSARGQDHGSLQVSGPVQISREGGFEFGEIVGVLGGIFNSLAPGWTRADTTAKAPVTESAGSVVLANTL